MTNAADTARNFDAAMESFLDFSQSLVSDNEGPDYPENCRTVLIVEKGRKYAKVIATGIEDSVLGLPACGGRRFSFWACRWREMPGS